jgi:[acyl-carrier-protein] S-malonyltransferase
MSYAILFPGQGSQYVGMGADVFAARPDLLGTAADSVLGWSLRDLCAAGPEDDLTRTDRAQPALYATAYALWEAFREAVGFDPVAGAGHSLGEYTALAAAGVFDFSTGLRLVAARGAAMDVAARRGDSGMAALIGVDEATAENVAATRRNAGGALWVANLNAPGQIVVAGGSDDIVWVAENGRDLGVRRAIPLKVAGAFHSPYMETAADELAAALSATHFAPPRFPVYANATAAPVGDVATNLGEQLVNPVRFAATLEAMATAGVDTFVHVGPGDVTAGMVKRTVPDASVLVVSVLDDIPPVAEALNLQ